MSDFKPGTMDITAQEKTFDAFVRMVTRVAIGVVVFLILLAMING